MKFRIATAQYPLQQHQDLNSWQKYVDSWVKEATAQQASLLVFPEYGAMELVSTMTPEVQKDLQRQVREINALLPLFIETYKKLAIHYQCSILAPSMPVLDSEQQPINRAYYFNSHGEVSFQDKHHMTRFEGEHWGVKTGDENLQILKHHEAMLGVCICYDVEFPGAANIFAKRGAKILITPSCTEGLSGCNRVHIGARARALENQCYVIVSQTVGDAEWSEAVDKNTGYAAVYGPSDVGFPDDGIIAKGELNQPGWLYVDIDLAKVDHVRKYGQVFNFLHS